MKKTFFILAVVAIAAIGMTSCSSDTKSCYKFTTTTGGVTVVTYDFVTKAQADATKANLTTSFSTCKYMVTWKSESDCKN